MANLPLFSVQARFPAVYTAEFFKIHTSSKKSNEFKKIEMKKL